MDDDYYILFSKDEKEECVMIIISKEEKSAEIHGIGNYQSCFMDTNENVGSTLLKITITLSYAGLSDVITKFSTGGIKLDFDGVIQVDYITLPLQFSYSI